MTEQWAAAAHVISEVQLLDNGCGEPAVGALKSGILATSLFVVFQ